LALAAAAASGARRGEPLIGAFAAPFGRHGASVLGVGLVLRNVVWAAFFLSFMASAASYFVEPVAGRGTHAVWVVVFAALGASFALTGPHLVLPWVVKRLLAPVALLMVLIIALSSYLEMGYPDLIARAPIGGWPGQWQGADLVALGVLAWLPVAADFTRFSARHSGSARAAFFGFAPSVFALAIIGALYVPLVTASESWQLLTAVPTGTMAFLMLLVLEADGVTALTYASGSTSQWITRERQIPTLAAAVAAGALAIAFLSGELEPTALALGLLFLPLVVVEPLDAVLSRWSRATLSGRRAGLLVAWLGAFLLGSWFYPGADGPWRAAVAWACDQLGLPFPLTDDLSLFGAFVPTVAAAVVLYPVVVFVRRRRGEDDAG